MGETAENVEHRWAEVRDDMTPAELRSVADRKELVAKALQFAERRQARNQVVEAIFAIPTDTVRQAGLDSALRDVLRAIAVDFERVADQITNGDVSRVTYGPPPLDANWWQHATADHPKADPDDALSRVVKGQFPW